MCISSRKKYQGISLSLFFYILYFQRCDIKISQYAFRFMLSCISKARSEYVVDTKGKEKSEVCAVDIRISFKRIDECNVIVRSGHWKAMACPVNQSSYKVQPNIDFDVHEVYDGKLTVLRKTCTSLKVRRFTWETWWRTWVKY